MVLDCSSVRASVEKPEGLSDADVLDPIRKEVSGREEAVELMSGLGATIWSLRSLWSWTFSSSIFPVETN